MAKIAWRVIAANAARAKGQIDRKDEERGVVGWIWASIIHGVIVAHLELGKRRNLAFPHNSQVWDCEVKEIWIRKRRNGKDRSLKISWSNSVSYVGQREGELEFLPVENVHKKR